MAKVIAKKVLFASGRAKSGSTADGYSSPQDKSFRGINLKCYRLRNSNRADCSH